MKDKETGFLVREGNSDDIIEKLKQILDNPNLAQQMGREGKEFVNSQFNWELVAKNFLKIIKPYLKN
jgi:glycosyltransferase involved in cell wall biosynthesis